MTNYDYCIELEPRDVGAPRFTFQDPFSSQTRPRRAALSIDQALRNGSTLTVCFWNGSSEQQSKVRVEVAKWMKFANIKFVYVPGYLADIRIDFTRSRGSSSAVGTNFMAVRPQDPKPTMYLRLRKGEPPDKFTARVLHEFGHTLGLRHEHSQPASPIIWNTKAVTDAHPKWTPAKLQNNIFKKYGPTAVLSSVFDTKSIMIYPILPGWNNNNPPISIPFNTRLSKLDKAFMKAAYPRDKVVPRTTTPNARSFRTTMLGEWSRVNLQLSPPFFAYFQMSTSRDVPYFPGLCLTTIKLPSHVPDILLCPRGLIFGQNIYRLEVQAFRNYYTCDAVAYQWLELPLNYPGVQFGSIATQNIDRWSKVARWLYPVYFDWIYDSPPKVVAFPAQIYLCQSTGYKTEVKVKNISRTGCLLAVTVTCDIPSTVTFVRVTWIAHPPDSRYVASGTVKNDGTPDLYQDRVFFGQSFRDPPTVLLGLTSINCPNARSLSIVTKVDTVSSYGMNWSCDTTGLNGYTADIKASYIAFGE